MSATVRETMLEMLASTVETMQLLLSAGDDCLELPSTHVCAHGKDTWMLLTNLIDHETEHTGQLAQARYEGKDRAHPSSAWPGNGSRFGRASLGSWPD